MKKPIFLKRAVAAGLAALALALFAHPAQADEFASARFQGGPSDGYAFFCISRDASVLASFVRFCGGSGDGYDTFTEEGLKVPPRGLLIQIF